jgi:hydroxyacyl-ACP dehydratase HTD2-like protein with hotdog domain
MIYACLKQSSGGTYWTAEDRLEQFKQWQGWRDRIVRTQTDQPFYLYFHLQDPVKPEDPGSFSFRWPPSTIPPSSLPGRLLAHGVPNSRSK